MKQYRANHKDRINYLTKERRKLPAVRLSEKLYSKQYYINIKNNPELKKQRLENANIRRKLRKYDKKYYSSAKGKVWIINMNHKRRERITNGNKRVTLQDIKDVYNRCKYQCINCNTKDNLTIDHIIPLSKGGMHEYSNLQILCSKCNMRKSNKIES
jgi:5-methylcytosine-specific restriction endonuclease McrA